MSALRGMNLGGWLVAERWMAPELFADVTHDGERAIGRSLGYDRAKERLEAHRDSFVTEKDFEAIALAGFDMVRLPVGYWLFEEEEGFVSGEIYVDRAFEWAKKHRLGVILDFHGLQGSQNGHDHSGQTGRVRLYSRDNRRRALSTMEYLAKRYGHEPALIGIEIINEPKVHLFMRRLLHYYDDAFRIAERHVAPQVKIIVSDAYKPLRMAKALAKRSYGERLVLDVHLYQVFRRRDQKPTFDERVEVVSQEWRSLLTELGSHVPNVLVGEWSAALPARAYKDVPGAEATKVGEYYATQEKLFSELAWGHCYWSYKTPAGGVWDYGNLKRHL